MTQIAVRRALVSVYDKTGLEELVRGLHEAGVEIVSTGSTAARIRELGVPVTAVDQVTGFPEILGGRVKTLHPHVHAGLLADQNDPEHLATIERLGIAPFQLLIANLYPFAETVASGADTPSVIEQIDIGGPAMVRASAKNHGSVAVIVDPSRYPEVLAAVQAGGFDAAARRRLAVEAFRHTATYDIGVASWLGSVASGESGSVASGESGSVASGEIGSVASGESGSVAYGEIGSAASGDVAEGGFPGWVAASWERAAVLRYGENPHQKAALYVSQGPVAPGLAQAEQLSGAELSYNNYVDADAAWRAAYDFDEPCVAIIKHANPCGIAVGRDIADAHAKAHACDPASAYGGVIATNGPVTNQFAEQIAKVLTEVIVAPAYEPDALERLSKRRNTRLLLAQPRSSAPAVELRPISGGVLMQTADAIDAPGDDPANWRLVAGEAADAATLADLRFAWRAVRAVKSNAILLASAGATVGVGMGQVNRVDSCRLAVSRAGERAAGSVAASDAFFPFPDGVQVLIDAGVRAVVQPGGSIRDDEVVATAQAAGVTLYLTGARHFAH